MKTVNRRKRLEVSEGDSDSRTSKFDDMVLISERPPLIRSSGLVGLIDIKQCFYIPSNER